MRTKRKASVCECGLTAFVSGTRATVGIVDAVDVALVGAWNWTASNSGHMYRRKPKSAGGETIFMHHEVLGKAPGLEVDHINGDRRDNRRANLRFVTKAQNQMNRVAVVAASGFKGVARNKKGWSASIKKRVEGKKVNYHLGTFKTPEEAAAAYDRAAVGMFGEFAKTNEAIKFGRAGYK